MYSPHCPKLTKSQYSHSITELPCICRIKLLYLCTYSQTPPKEWSFGKHCIKLWFTKPGSPGAQKVYFQTAWVKNQKLDFLQFPQVFWFHLPHQRSLWKILPTNPSLANTPPWFFSSAMVVNSRPASSVQTQYMGRKQCSFTTCICLPKPITVCWTTWSLNTQIAIPRTWVSDGSLCMQCYHRRFCTLAYS